EQLRAAAGSQDDPLEQLRVTIELLYELCRPDPTAQRPLFTDFAPQLLVSHPAQVKIAHAPVLGLITELMEKAAAQGKLRTDLNARRTAAMVMQTVMFTAQSTGATDEETAHPITAEEVWDFCARGFTQE
ncbi:MAG: TetR/AcrR family transcriptional regulator, partial [Stackebrandtia sp.]